MNRWRKILGCMGGVLAALCCQGPAHGMVDLKPLATIMGLQNVPSYNNFPEWFPSQATTAFDHTTSRWEKATWSLADSPFVMNAFDKKISQFCDEVDRVYHRYSWGRSPCLSLPWRYSRVSEHGMPLVYWEYNGATDQLSQVRPNTTVILGGVHADELTPVHMAFKIADSFFHNPELYKNSRVIVAPLVNPDGFFHNPPVRTNADGVDLNRNFPTSAWLTATGKQIWAKARESDKRKYPGDFANSEQGTRFQTDLLARFLPTKIISIHSPLDFLDIDYDSSHLFSGKYKRIPLTAQQARAKQLTLMIAKSAGRYPIQDFSNYPGSLGNYAGNERSIPTITLELNSADPRMVKKFWHDFSDGIFQAVGYEWR